MIRLASFIRKRAYSVLAESCDDPQAAGLSDAWPPVWGKFTTQISKVHQLTGSESLRDSLLDVALLPEGLCGTPAGACDGASAADVPAAASSGKLTSQALGLFVMGAAGPKCECYVKVRIRKASKMNAAARPRGRLCS